jgi:hypothetical protein
VSGTRRRAVDLVLGVLRHRLDLAPPAGGPAPDPAAAPEAAWREAVRLAADHLVAPALGAAVADLAVPVPGDAGPFLALLARRNRERNAALREALLGTAAELNRLGIEPVLLKGALRLVDDLYPDPGWRFLSDLDLLVPAERAGEAWAHLRGRGFAPTPLEEPWAPVLPHLAPLVHPRARVRVEVHRATLMAPFDAVLPAAEVVGGAAEIRVEGVRMRRPRADHQLVHLVAHAQLHHGLRHGARAVLRDLIEAALLLRRLGDAGPTVLRAALARHGRGRAAEAYLALVRSRLGADTPAPRPGVGTRLWLRWADLNLASPRAAAASGLAGHACFLLTSRAARAGLAGRVVSRAFWGRRGRDLARVLRPSSA